MKKMMKIYKLTLALLLLAVLTLTVCPIQLRAASDEGIYVVDNANLIGDGEEAALNTRLAEISAKYDTNVIVYTDSSLYNMTPEECADAMLDSDAFKKRGGGILFMVNTEENDWAFSTVGTGITAFTDAGQEYMIGKIKPKLSDKAYDKAFNIYADLADDFLKQAATGKPYDKGNLPKGPFQAVKDAIIAIVAGFLASLARVTKLKGETKTVKKATKATTYLVGGVTLAGAQEVYRNSEFRPVVRSTGGGGGSSTHVSSSGTVHGGSSGKF